MNDLDTILDKPVYTFEAPVPSEAININSNTASDANTKQTKPSDGRSKEARKAKKVISQHNYSVRPTYSNVELMAKFVKSVKETLKTDYGANDGTAISSFCAVAWMVLTNYKGHTFDLDTFTTLAAGRGTLSPEDMRGLFGEWTNFFCNVGKVKRVASCYDSDLFQIV